MPYTKRGKIKEILPIAGKDSCYQVVFRITSKKWQRAKDLAIFFGGTLGYDIKNGKIKAGDNVIVEFVLSSTVYMGKIYNNISASTCVKKAKKVVDRGEIKYEKL